MQKKLLTKSKSDLCIEDKFFQSNKGFYENLTGNTELNGETLNAFSLRSGSK